MKQHKHFRVYPFHKKKGVYDKSCWWTVDVSEDEKELRRKAVKKCVLCKHPLGGSKDCLGLTHRHGFKQYMDDYGNIASPSLKGELGIIFLAKQHTGGGIVSHEMCHAMLYTVLSYTHVINFDHPRWRDTDENMAQILGNLVNGFYTNFL